MALLLATSSVRADDTVSSIRADDPVVVYLDKARIIKLPDRAVTVVIGNPLIADISVQPGGLAVVTGRSYGATNLMILDVGNAVLTERNIEVQEPTDEIVEINLGINRATYSCTPECGARVTLGDQTEFFNEILTEVSTRNLFGKANPNDHWVEPHSDKNGRFIPGHYQTNPNDTEEDNYGTKGNINPHTGEEGTRNPRD
jgi:hypothetical protein